MTMDDRRRWIALIVLCLGDLMIVLDATIVNAWVVNAYLLTFGGFLLLAGRLGDLYGAEIGPPATAEAG